MDTAPTRSEEQICKQYLADIQAMFDNHPHPLRPEEFQSIPGLLLDHGLATSSSIGALATGYAFGIETDRFTMHFIDNLARLTIGDTTRFDIVRDELNKIEEAAPLTVMSLIVTPATAEEMAFKEDHPPLTMQYMFSFYTLYCGREEKKIRGDQDSGHIDFVDLSPHCDTPFIVLGYLLDRGFQLVIAGEKAIDGDNHLQLVLMREKLQVILDINYPAASRAWEATRSKMQSKH